MNYFLLLMSILSIPTCKPASESLEKWDLDKSSYLEVSISPDQYSWQYDLYRNGTKVPAGAYRVMVYSFSSEDEFDEENISATPEGSMAKSTPKYAITVVPVEDKNQKIVNLKCNAVNRTLSGTIPLLCQDEEVDWLVDPNVGDCETPNKKLSSKNGGIQFESEFNRDKSIRVVLRFIGGTPILDHVESKFSESLGLSNGRNRTLAEEELNNFVPFSTNAYQAGKLVTPSVIVRKENNIYRLYLIQADKDTKRAPTYLMAEFKDGDEIKTSSGNSEFRTFNATLAKNICAARLKSNNQYAEYGKAFYLLPEVPTSR